MQPSVAVTLKLGLGLGLGMGLALAATSAALAGQCPADQVLTEPRQIEEAPDVGVTRPVLHAVDLTGWRGMGSFNLRMRMLTVDVGGTVPTHAHDDRPSIIYVVSGEIVEHNSFCAVPIVHKAGDSTPEFGQGHRSWWANKTDQPVVLISADVIPVAPKADAAPMPDPDMP
ncbi:MAG: hypothetical protein B7Z31_00875 [Rhodobacterales bacterium 12-65-15]|nr:MAG: hypothetical protein B7Z31_00875 [Rhodobacterales bacterium 12-65-15]